MRAAIIEGEAEVGYLLSQKQLFIGGRNDHRYNFEGKMDEVSVYNRVLTPAEIAQHYQASGVTPPRNQ